MNNNKRPTIATVAAHAGLSVATVDRVLNARAPVNPDTAEQVFQAAEAVGYFAARLIGQRIRERRPAYRFGILLLGTGQLPLPRPPGASSRPTWAATSST
mgnify:CR=1 FL=1